MVTDPLEVNRPELKNTESSYHEENEVIRSEKKPMISLLLKSPKRMT